jgi:hypothetical protein
MPGGITLLAALPASIPTPPANKVTIFFNITAGQPYYKDSSGNLFPLVGTPGISSPIIPAVDGDDGLDGFSNTPGPIGLTGPTGPTGPVGGVQFFVGVDGEDSEDLSPGTPGVQGIQGIQGIPGTGGGGSTVIIPDEESGQSLDDTIPLIVHPTLAEIVAINELGAGFPNITSKKTAFGYPTSNSTVLSGIGNALVASSISNFIDTITTWLRATAGSTAGNQAGQTISGALCWLDHEPTLEVKFRTGSVITNVRYYVLLTDLFSALPPNNDALQARRGVGFRFSTIAGDTGWVPWTADGTTQTIGATCSPAMAANTTYILRCTVSVGAGTATMSVNGGPPVSVAIGAAALGTAVGFMWDVITTATTVTHILDLAAFRVQYN